MFYSLRLNIVQNMERGFEVVIAVVMNVSIFCDMYRLHGPVSQKMATFNM
jgi:hypothetical protein